MYSIVPFILLLLICESTYTEFTNLEFNLEHNVPSTSLANRLTHRSHTVSSTGQHTSHHSSSSSSSSSLTGSLSNSLTSSLTSLENNLTTNLVSSPQSSTLTSSVASTSNGGLQRDLNRRMQMINLNSKKLKSIDRHTRSKLFKHYLKSRTFSRRRRRNTSSNLSLNEQIDKRNDGDLLPLSHKLPPSDKPIKKQLDFSNLNQSLANLTLHYQTFIDNYYSLALDGNSSSLNGTDLYNLTNNNTTTYVELPPSLKVFFYCVYTLIFFVGLIGNSLNIYVVYSNKNMYNVTYFFITNLAMSDILLCLFSVPITPMYLLLYKHWPFGKLLCHLLPFSQGVSVYVSAFTLMSIAVDRYFVIIFPFKKRMSVKMCVIIIIIIWISGSTLTLPYAIFMQLVEVELEDGRKLRFCEEAWPHDTSRRTFSTCTSVIQFIVPFVIIAFCYSKVCSKLKTRAKFKPGAKSARKEELERERSRRTNRMLIAMVIIFGLAWLPLNVHNLVVDFYETANNWPYIRCFFLLAHAIAMSCTCYNFCLYAYLNDHFRKNFKDVLPCLFDVPFFQRIRNDQTQNQSTNTPNVGTLKMPSIGPVNTTSSSPLTKDLITKTEPSTKQMMLTDDENDLCNNNHRLVQQNSMCSEPVDRCLDDGAASAKCPCSISYPTFPQISNFQSTDSSLNEPQLNAEKESTTSSKQLLKSLRNKLRFSGESSFDEQAIALSEYSLREPNNNSLIKSSDQVINASPTANCCSSPNGVSANGIGQPNISANNVSNNGKCNTIYLSGLNDKNLTLQMDNV